MPILDRGSLEQSPLADLHAIASELSIDGYRRLRKPELIEAILGRQDADGDGGESQAVVEEPEPDDAPSRRRGRRRRSSEPKPVAEGPDTLQRGKRIRGRSRPEQADQQSGNEENSSR